MARGNDQAQAASKTANANSGTFMGNAQSLYSNLTPQLMAEAAHPAGMNPADMAAAETAAEQSAGGSEAGAVGQGALYGARTRNAGAPAAAIAESTRTAGQDLSKNALGIHVANAALKEKQRRAALAEEGALYGTNAGAANNALGEVASNVNANTNAANQSWDWAKYILDPAMAAAGSGAGLAAH